jgi:hypothetical protein
MRLRTIALAGLAIASSATTATAQVVPGKAPGVEPAPGDRVRLHYGADGKQQVEGSWIGVNDGAVRVLVKGRADTAQIALTEVASLERSTGQRSHWGTGLVVGLLGGALVGGAIGTLAGHDDPDFMAIHQMFGAGVGAAVGGLLGAAVGSSIKSDRWEAGLLPSRGGTATITIRF